MGVIILFGGLMALFACVVAIDIQAYKDYPVTDESWIAGGLLILFIGSVIGMTLI
tara:strand:+ start:3262 stop:3426 length:165 start_codon:yes stop_codon:yes gene_type:complete